MHRFEVDRGCSGVAVGRKGGAKIKRGKKCGEGKGCSRGYDWNVERSLQRLDISLWDVHSGHPKCDKPISC